MPRKTQKPWNAGKDLFPELTGKPQPPPAPMPETTGPRGLTTGHMVKPLEPEEKPAKPKDS